MRTYQETPQEYEDPFNENDFQFDQIALQNGETALSPQTLSSGESFPDKFLKAIKYLFFFVPGAFLLTMIGPSLFIAILYSDFVQPILGLLVCGGVGSFLTMLGMGKLKDLSYLKVPGFIILFSMVVGFLVLPIAFYFHYDLGILLPFFFISAILGYLVKKSLDKADETELI